MSNRPGGTREDECARWASALRHDGYIVLRRLLTPDAVEELRCAFGPATAGSTLHVAIDEHTPAGRRWLGLADHPVVKKLLDEVLGDHEVRVHGRDPGKGAGAQGLHADRPAGRVHEVDAVTVLWMLDDFVESNGATRVVPGSHRGAAAVPKHLAQPRVHHPDEVVITGRAGDALIFDAHLWHSGRLNESPLRRRVVQMAVTRSVS